MCGCVTKLCELYGKPCGEKAGKWNGSMDINSEKCCILNAEKEREFMGIGRKRGWWRKRERGGEREVGN